MIPLDIVSGGFDMVRNGGRVVIFNEGLEVFSFSIMRSSFCFTDVEIIAIPATGFVNYFRFLRTIQAVLVWKERFDAAIICQVYIKMRKFIMFITAVCVLFLIKVRWPRNKGLYDTRQGVWENFKYFRFLPNSLESAFASGYASSKGPLSISLAK